MAGCGSTSLKMSSPITPPLKGKGRLQQCSTLFAAALQSAQEPEQTNLQLLRLHALHHAPRRLHAVRSQQLCHLRRAQRAQRLCPASCSVSLTGCRWPHWKPPEVAPTQRLVCPRPCAGGGSWRRCSWCDAGSTCCSSRLAVNESWRGRQGVLAGPAPLALLRDRLLCTAGLRNWLCLDRCSGWCVADLCRSRCAPRPWLAFLLRPLGLPPPLSLLRSGLLHTPLGLLPRLCHCRCSGHGRRQGTGRCSCRCTTLRARQACSCRGG